MKKIKLQTIVPFIAFAVIFLFFTIASKGKMVSAYNLGMLIDQSMVIIIIGSGMLFVVAQGSIDLSVGVNLALSGVIGMWAATATGIPLLLIPVSLAVGAIIGLFNGAIVSMLKVPSFILTIALLIGVPGIVHLIQTQIGAQYLSSSLRFLNMPAVKIPLFIVIVALMAVVFEFKKSGRYCRAIGENETVPKFVGVPITKVKILAFMLSGLMAGVGSIFSILTVGGTSQTMGSFMEMKVAMAMFLGGVLVTGGTSAKIYKMLLGSFSITIIVNGLAIIGYPESQTSESVEGILLLLILIVTIIATGRDKKRGSPPDNEVLLDNQHVELTR
ncbi:ribose transport system permease protein [Sporobacter termitidis DSM 10068]|uniref:Ribose transport system permease protein n=2 Tax=Sporobacter TaxID=44748 RepID=A0A1M5WLJ1_9FIRM|nr:ribose transport system permease protein [Sporobacter termitidis DSM 10068]